MQEIIDFLKNNPEKYDFSDDGEDRSENYRNTKGFKKLFAYVYPTVYYGKTLGDFGKMIDPDSGSQLLQMIYKILWNIDDECPYPEIVKVQGETLNSVWTTLDKMYFYLESGEEKSARIKRGQNRISKKWILDQFLDEGTRTDAVCQILENDDVREFVECYHTLGNFMPVPVDCNAPRGFAAVKDYWDLTLLCIYHYYDDTESNKTVFIKKILDNGKPNVEKNITRYEAWLGRFDGWSDFVEKNYLEDFVKSDYYPKELWSGHFENFENDNIAKPENEIQCVEYFKNAKKLILARGYRMINQLKEKCGMSEARLDLLLAQKANCANIAKNLIDVSDEEFERFFEEIYQIDKQFLAVFIRNSRDRITPEQYEFARDFYSKRGYKVRWK